MQNTRTSLHTRRYIGALPKEGCEKGPKTLLTGRARLAHSASARFRFLHGINFDVGTQDVGFSLCLKKKGRAHRIRVQGATT